MNSGIKDTNAKKKRGAITLVSCCGVNQADVETLESLCLWRSLIISVSRSTLFGVFFTFFANDKHQ